MRYESGRKGYKKRGKIGGGDGSRPGSALNAEMTFSKSTTVLTDILRVKKPRKRRKSCGENRRTSALRLNLGAEEGI